MRENQQRVISFYDEFHCIGGDCAYTCCENWLICVDDETLARYRKEPGILGAKVRLNLKHHKTQGIVFRNFTKACSFHGRDGLCSLQKRGRIDLMPLVCRIYPRRIVKVCGCTEAYLELSCIQAVSIFLRHQGRLYLKPYEQELPVFWEITEAEADCYEFLKKSREKMLDILWAEGDFFVKIRQIEEYAYTAYQWISRDRLEKAGTVSLPPEERDKEDLRIPDYFPENFPYGTVPVAFLNQLIYRKINQQELHRANPYFEQLLAAYRKQYGAVMEEEADGFFAVHVEQMLKKRPEFLWVFRSYYSYFLQRSYMDAAYDYYILSPVIFAGIYTELLILCYLTAYESGKKLTDYEQAELIANMEKTFRHNPTFDRWVLDKIRRELFSK